MPAFSVKFVFISSLIVYIAYFLYNSDLVPSEEFYYNTTEFIKKYGYDVEEHEVLSSDGVITTIFRIPPAKGRKKVGKPIIFENGLFCSSDVMVLTGPKTDIPFVLSDEGFDVWLANFRGSRYGRLAEKSGLSEEDVINCGMHDLSYDVAAGIDHILKITGEEKVDLVGVSLGSPAALILLASQPEYNSKISKFLHFGAGISLKLDNKEKRFFFNLFWKYPAIARAILPPYRGRPTLINLVCYKSWLSESCMEFFDQIVGLPDGKNSTLTVLTMTLLPSGAPMGVLDHLMQLSQNDIGFRMRDCGEDENIKRYNSKIPPLYDLSNISVWSKSYVSENEVLVDTEAMKKALNTLRHPPEIFTVPRPFAHANFFINSVRDRNFIEDVIKTLKSSSYF